MENQTDFAQGQQQGQMGREQQAFQQQAQQQGRGRGALVALAVVGLLVGVGGAGFGVYGMTQNKTTTQPADLKVKVEKADGSIVELDTDQIKKADDGTAITIPDSANTPEKYILLGDYNLGLKIPSDSKLQYIQYEYRQFNGGPNYSSLGIGGVTKKEGAQALPEFVAQGESSDIYALGYIDICSNNTKYDEDTANLACGGDPVYKNDSISIYYVGPQAVLSRDSDTAQWELETVKAIKDWVSNKDNYIKL